MFPLAADCRSWGCDLLLGIYKWPTLGFVVFYYLCSIIRPPVNLQSTPGVNIFVHSCEMNRVKEQGGEKVKKRKSCQGSGVGVGAWRWWQAQHSSVCQLKNISSTDSVQNNPVLILTIPVSFQCFLTFSYDLHCISFGFIFLRVT